MGSLEDYIIYKEQLKMIWIKYKYNIFFIFTASICGITCVLWRKHLIKIIKGPDNISEIFLFLMDMLPWKIKA